MEKIFTCPVCRSPLGKPEKFFYSRPFVPLNVSGLDIVMCALVGYSRCEACGVHVQNPMLTEDEMKHYYGDGLYRQWLGRTQEELDDDELMRASTDAALLHKTIGPVKTHLDIGASHGDFLHLMGAEFQVGVEPNTPYFRNDRAVLASDISLVKGTYELVSLIHSLEHTLDPMQTLKQAASLSNRWIVIEVPSEESKGGWGRLAHTFHFPDETIQYLAESISCKIKLIHHTPHTLVVMEKNHPVDAQFVAAYVADADIYPPEVAMKLAEERDVQAANNLLASIKERGD
jgi:hypothetical protein